MSDTHPEEYKSGKPDIISQTNMYEWGHKMQEIEIDLHC